MVTDDSYAGKRAIEFNVKPGVRLSTRGTGMLVEGVTLLSPGIWVDSAVGTPLEYTEAALREYATNWHSNRLWSVHTGGMPRRITDFVGDIENPRFENGSLKGDLFFHMLTDESRDTLSLVKGGIEGHIQPVSFSIEHEGKEIYMKESGHYTTDSLLFHGGAIVDEGASGGTKIMGEGMSDNVRYLSKFTKSETTELEEIKTEVETMLDEETKAEIRAMIKEAIAGQAPVEDPPKDCLLYTSPSPRDGLLSRMPSSA